MFHFIPRIICHWNATNQNWSHFFPGTSSLSFQEYYPEWYSVSPIQKQVQCLKWEFISQREVLREMSKIVWMTCCLEITLFCTSEGSLQWLSHALVFSSVRLCKTESISVWAQLCSRIPASGWEDKIQMLSTWLSSRAYSTPVFERSAASLGLSIEWSGGYPLLHNQARGGDTS